MSIDQSILNDLTRTGGSAVKWDKVGDVRKIVIAEARKRQATDFATGQLDWWDAEKTQPKEQVVILGTDPDTAEHITMYVKWWGGMKRAFISALDGKNLEVGGTLAFQWSDEEPADPKVGKKFPTRVWKAQYQPPVAVALGSDDLI